MSVDLIRYDLLVQDALRAVVRRVLTDVAREGLPGDHHLFISFDTKAPGVRLSPRLKERYPEEMTIILQHQFWDLVVTDIFLEVGLSFNGIPERLHVPFAALKGFFDPSVKFGLQFEPTTAAAEDEQEPSAPTALRPTSVPSLSVPGTSVPSTRPAVADVSGGKAGRGEARSEIKSETNSESRPETAGAKPFPAKLSPAGADKAKPEAAAKSDKPKTETGAAATDKPEPGKSASGKSEAGKSESGKADSGKSGSVRSGSGKSGSGPSGTFPSDEDGDGKDGPRSGAQVVRLDAFRKK
ncbi:hypothetical protein QOZ99_001160 [Angulomicrobium amanitiforme]|uniref:Stringent starvation protein B n=1 Tax=Ancylobacter amanitiformis TaxID=217069 RepID=A0ABU0LNJ8_9HYPH|nr:ClpXP protease specificity-enhancing factor SspB [Ancylobacter amanitiformis]MDQ0510277.1 hypothetical protein [Ancylobacter amanitiformis]